jgi:ankyrin repeat protein
MLIKAGADVNVRDPMGKTPISYAILRGPREIWQLLISRGADLRNINNAGYGILHEIAASGDFDRDLVPGVLDNAQDKQGENAPKHFSSAGTSTTSTTLDVKHTLKTLVTLGCSINSQNVDGVSPLHLAAVKHHSNMVRLLLELGADSCSINSDGEIPLLWALCGSVACYNFGLWPREREKDRLACVQLFIDAGADVKVDKSLALHWAIAAMWDSIDVDLRTVEALTVGLTNIDAANEDGISPLHFASFYGRPKTTALLLRKGAKPNISPRLPMLIAAVMREPSNVQVIELLLDVGADVVVYDEDGTSLLAWVILTGSLYTFSIIIAHLPIEWLDRELPVIGAVVESDEKRAIDDLYLRRLSCLAQAYAITRVKKTQNGPNDEVHQPNVPVVLPAWLPSEERFPVMLFARSICGTEGSKHLEAR